jgi:hypothetical protein
VESACDGGGARGNGSGSVVRFGDDRGKEGEEMDGEASDGRRGGLEAHAT